MAKKEYDWLNGAELLDHTRRKLKILDDYLFDYLTIRCQVPQQQKFRLAIVDGFAGGGRYRCGSAGSPLVFIEGLERALNKINIDRTVQGLGEIELECLLILNDRDGDVVELLKRNCAPRWRQSRHGHPSCMCSRSSWLRPSREPTPVSRP